MRDEFVSRQQVKLLPERIRKAEETRAAKELSEYMWNLFRQKEAPMNILFVGAGGSYPAALFAKHVMQYRMRTPNVEAVTPQTAIRIFTQFDNIINCTWNPQYDLVIGISYSGKTPDMKSVSELCAKKGYPFVLLTGADKTKLSNVYKESDGIKIISYFNAEDTTGKEKGVISMASTLAPVIIFYDDSQCQMINQNQRDLAIGEKFVSDLNISGIAEAIKKHPTIHVFYEWDTLPTAMDIESKFTESGIANVVLHEKKNFSHGRTALLYCQDFSLVINLTKYGLYWMTDYKFYRTKYDEALAIFLTQICKEKSAQYIEIGTATMMAAQWNIEALTKLPYLITAIGEELGIDISKPLYPYPKEAITLYNYEGKF